MQKQMLSLGYYMNDVIQNGVLPIGYNRFADVSRLLGCGGGHLAIQWWKIIPH